MDNTVVNPQSIIYVFFLFMINVGFIMASYRFFSIDICSYCRYFSLTVHETQMTHCDDKFIAVFGDQTEVEKTK